MVQIGSKPFGVLEGINPIEGIKIGLVTVVDIAKSVLTVELPELGGAPIDIPFQCIASPMVTSGNPITADAPVKKFAIGSFALPDNDQYVGSYAIIYFYNKEFPIVLGFVPGGFTASKNRGTYPTLNPGEYLIKSKTYSSVYLQNTGEVRVSSRNTPVNGTTEQSYLSLTANINLVSASGNITITGSSGTLTVTGNAVNINSPTGTQNAARKGDTTVVDTTSDLGFIGVGGWVSRVSTALSSLGYPVAPVPTTITGTITTGS